MSRFADNSFDFILFSFNGIDYVNSSDRSIVFREIYRICKPDGIFCFSTHNIQSLNQIFSFKFKLNPLDLYIAIFTYLMLRLKNPRWQRFKNLDECELVDLGEWFKLKTVYIKPIKQITCLKNLGFKNIRVFSYNNGLEIKKYEILTACQDVWLQYLCQCSK
jgi:SAM-dependent methyltransferase